MDAAVLFFAFLWALMGGGKAERRTSAPAQLPSGQGQPQGIPTSAPWPQVVPAGLPPFPGSGWQYDEPPPRAVVQRAGALVNQLWQGGAGTFKIEETAGRWIAYRAEIMRSGKKGVAAYRQKSAASPSGRPAGAPAQTAQAPATPAAATASRAPAAAPVKVSLPANSRLLPTLRRGMGIKPQAPNDDVRLMQRQLRINPDGQFGGGTETALRAFQTLQVAQKRPGWTPEDIDGICGPKSWTALLEQKA